MVQEERWVSRAVVQIGARVSTDGVMSAAVDANRAGNKILKQVLKTPDIGAILDKKGNLFVCRLRCSLLADVTAHAPWVVAKAIDLWVRLDTGQVVLQRAHIDPPAVALLAGYARFCPMNILLHRSRRDAATSIGRLKCHQTTGIAWQTGSITSRNVGTISRKTRLTAIKQRRLGRIICPPRPAVVRLVAFVSALVAKYLLVCPCIVAMPGEEIASAMNVHSLEDV